MRLSRVLTAALRSSACKRAPSMLALIATLSLGLVACSSSKDEPDPVAVPNYGPSAGTSAKAGRKAVRRTVAQATPQTPQRYAAQVQAPTYTYPTYTYPQAAVPHTTYAAPPATYTHAARPVTTYAYPQGTVAPHTTYTYPQASAPTYVYPNGTYQGATVSTPTPHAGAVTTYAGTTPAPVASAPAPSYTPAPAQPTTTYPSASSPYYGAGPTSAAAPHTYPAQPPPGYTTPAPRAATPNPVAPMPPAPPAMTATPTPNAAPVAPPTLSAQAQPPAYTPPVAVNTPAPTPQAQPTPEPFRWYYRWSEAQAAARQSGRHILVLSTKPDCKICDYFKETTVPQTENELRFVAVGYINEILSPEVVAVDNILRDNLPTAKFMPLVGFLTADMQWVHGFSGKRTPDQFRSDIQRVPTTRSYAGTPAQPGDTATATAGDPMLPPPATYADVNSERRDSEREQREAVASNAAARAAEAEAAFREGAEAVVNEFGETEWNNPKDVWPGQDPRHVARAPEATPERKVEPRGVFASSSQSHSTSEGQTPHATTPAPIASQNSGDQYSGGIAPPPLPEVPGVTHPYGNAVPVEAPVELSPEVLPPNAPAPDAEPGTVRRTSSRADAWAHEMLQGALEDIRKGRYDRARDDLQRVRRRMPHTAAAREAAKGAIAIHNAERIEAARTTSEQRLYLSRARRDLGNSYWSSLFQR